MHTIDYVIIALLAWGIFRGVVKGLILQVASILSLLIIVLLGIRLSIHLSMFLTETLSLSFWFMPLISFLIVVLLLLFLGWIIGKIFTRIIKLTPAATLNSLGGAVLGLLKMALIVGLLLRFIYAFDIHQQILTENTRKTSVTIHPLISLTFFVEPIFNDIKTQYQQFHILDEDILNAEDMGSESEEDLQ